MSAGAELQAVAVSALEGVAELGSAHDGPPLQAVVPYAIVEAGPERDWSHKSGIGREVRLAVTIRDEGERPQRLRRLMGEGGCICRSGGRPWLAAGDDASPVQPRGEGPPGRLVTMHLLSSRAAKDRQGGWIGLVEFRARLLRL